LGFIVLCRQKLYPMVFQSIVNMEKKAGIQVTEVMEEPERVKTFEAQLAELRAKKRGS